MTYVLVHGATFAASCWDLLVPHLDQETIAVDLPGRGSRPADLGAVTIQHFVDAVVAEIEDRDLHDVVLVGHSLAGITLPGVMDRVPHRLARVVFVAASVPEHGQSIMEALDAATREVAEASASSGEIATPVDWARAVFCNDMDDDAASWTLAHMGGEASGVMNEPVDLSGLRRGVPRTWVRLLRDAVVSPEQQSFYASRVGAEVVDLDAGHMAMISRPVALAEVLRSLHSDAMSSTPPIS